MLLYAVLAAAVVLDAATTLYMLSIGGREVNPLLRALFGVVGPAPAMLLTHMGVLAIVWLDLPHTPPHLLAAVALVWWGLVVWNCVQIRRQFRNRS